MPAEAWSSAGEAAPSVMTTMGHAPAMAAGQERSRTRIAALLDAARQGHSGVLVLHGEAGIGKTTLLRQAVSSAAGMTVLVTRGSESESSTPLCALADLLRPLRPVWRRLEPPWRDLLAGILALDADLPVVARRGPLHTATLLALAAAAEEAPLLVVVDDAHWLDEASATTLRFVLRRLDAERIAVLVAARAGHPAFTEDAGFAADVLQGLDGEDLAVVLAAHGLPVAPRVATEIARATGGNPLAAIECARLLGDARRRGTAALPHRLPIGRAVEREFARQVRSLPEPCRLALLVLAADEEARLAEAVQAMELLGTAVEDLLPAEQLGLVTLEGERADWRHPLIRLAAYHVAAAPDRRRVHAALASVVGDTFRRADHTGAAAVGLDEPAAHTLDSAASKAWALGLPEIATDLWQRSAELSKDARARCRRLSAGARAASQAGRLSLAEQLASLAIGLAETPAERARLVQLRCRSSWALGHAAVHEELAAAAEEIAGTAPGEAADLFADAAMNALGCALVARSGEMAERAVELAERTASDRGRLAAVRAIAGQVLICAGRVAEGYPMLVDNQDAIDADRSLVALFMCFGRIIAEDFEGARERLERFAEQARAAGAVEALGYPLGHLADLDLRTGHWARAYARAAEAVQAAELAGQRSIRTFGLAWLARIEAFTGRDAECRAHVEEIAGLTRECDQALLTYAHLARADLALGRGHPAHAVEAYRAVREMQAERGEADHHITPWLPGMIEALVALGRRRDAAELLERHREGLQSDQRRWPRAVLGRMLGMLAEDEREAEAAFAGALAVHDELPMPFERARTELALGTARRRAARRREARRPLGSAHRTFVALGALPWAERAARELAATGERARAAEAPAGTRLSPQELSIATLVAEGRTNLEVAAALFLSPKTVEAHLSRTYRKLGVANRSQLGWVMRELGDEADAEAAANSRRAGGPAPAGG